MTTYLPGHVTPEQLLDSLDWPSQVLPPFEGCGVSQARVRSCVPSPPHMAEQGVHWVHSLHPPSTNPKEYQANVKFVKQIQRSVI